MAIPHAAGRLLRNYDVAVTEESPPALGGPALGLTGTAICRLNTKKTADPVGNRKGREASDFHIMPHSDAAHIRLQGETKRYGQQAGQSRGPYERPAGVDGLDLSLPADRPNAPTYVRR